MAGAALASVALPASAAPEDMEHHRAMLAAYVDVLLPADAASPAASTLGVGDAILDLAADQPLLARLIAMVGDWLDGSGQGPFASMDPARRAAIVDHMAAADPDVLEGRFHQLIRLLAIEFYYAHPAALAGLDLAASPQPAGYPPPWA